MYKLLIVDDEPRVRNGLCNRIPWEKLGFSEICQASNGLEAFRLARELQPHVIITDICMPDMDGLDFIRKLRENNLSCRVIFISGYGEFSYAQQALRLGASDYLLKPIFEDDLYDRVARLLDEISGEQSADDAEEKVPDTGNSIVDKALLYIDEHFREDISLTDLADKICVHPNYLSSMFTKVCDKSFTRLLSERRVEAAKELMNRSELKIYEISEQVGYSDYRWFSRIFKQVEGTTPKQYLMNIHRNNSH